MSFGAGHMQDMINRMKQNRAQRASSKNKFKENSRDAIYSDSSDYERPKYKTVSDEELFEIKQKIHRKAEIRQKKEYIVGGIIFLLMLSVLFYLFYN